MYGLDDFYLDILEEAKSPEQVKEWLKKTRFSDIPSEVIDKVVDLDPTKKKSYSVWALLTWKNDSDLLVKCINDGTLEKIFKYFQERNNTGLNLADIKSLKDAINMLPETDPILTKNGNGGPEDEYDIVYNSPEWKIAVPHTYPASEKLGKGCRWCTAGAFRDGESYYNQYTRSGPLWINYDMRSSEICPMDNKEYPYTRYQFCFETGDFRDCHDEEIESFSDLDMPEGVVEFYRNEDESYGETIDEDSVSDDARYERYLDERENAARCIKAYKDLYYLTAYPEYDEYEYQLSDHYYLYDEEDTRDPIMWEEIDENDCVVNDYGEDAPAIIIKTLSEDYYFCFLNDNDYWDSLPIKDNNYQEIDNILIFASKNDFSLYDFSKKKLFKMHFKQADEISLDKVSKGLKVENSNAIFDSNNFYFHIKFDYGEISSNVSLVSYDGSSIERIINTDRPANNKEEYELSETKNGDFVIKGEVFTHRISGESYETFTLKDYSIIAKINDDFYLLEDKFNRLKNIYSKRENKLLFSNFGYQKILKLCDDFNVVLIFDDEKAYFYDCYTKQKLYKDYAGVNGIVFTYNNSKIIYGYSEKNNNIYNNCDFFSERVNLLFSCKNFIGYDRKFGVLIYSNGENPYENICLQFIDEKKPFITNANNVFKFDQYTGISSCKHDNFLSYNYNGKYEVIYVARNSGGVLYSTSLKQPILDNIVNMETYERNGEILYSFTNNVGETKFLLIGNEIKINDSTIPSNLIVTDLMNPPTVCYKNGNKLYFYNMISKKTFPQNGLDYNLISNIEKIGHWDCAYLIVTKNGSEIYVDYNGNVTSQNGENAESDINMIFGNRTEQINESFKSFMKRINSVKK